MSMNTQVNTSKTRRIPSDEELMALPKDGYKRELLNGEIVMSPAGSEHGRKIMRFATVLGGFVYQHKLGEIFDGQTGFRMKSLDVLSPDISFVPRDRLITLGGNPEGFFEGAPDLAIEFLSPGDSKKRLREKLSQYLENGTRLAWVMDSKKRTVAVHRPGETERNLSESAELSGEDVVPGFAISVASVFAEFDYRR
jgi:Uma2 family endonuclease